MKSHRTTLTLTGLFLAGLFLLWALERSGVPTIAQQRERAGRVVPELGQVAAGEIGRVRVVRGREAFEFERRGRDGWQMTRPLNVAADPSTLETLIRNLKELRPSPDAGTIEASGEDYELSPPRASIMIWRSGEPAGSPPLATLDIGREVRGQTFVKPAGSARIDVVDGKLLSALRREIPEFREQSLMPVPTFQVKRVTLRRGPTSIVAERSPGGRWQLATPIALPANGPKIESLLAACASIRVADAASGFVADDVNDFAPYGLDPPTVTISLVTASNPEEPLVLEVGKRVPDSTDRVYVRRSDQDDVVSVSNRFLSEIPARSTDLRSHDVTAIAAGSVSDLRIDAMGMTFELRRQRDGWVLTAPTSERADTASVRGLLEQLGKLRASEFLEPSRVPRPELEPPVMTIKAWQQVGRPGAGAPGSSQGPSVDPPALHLRIGRHDVLKKTVYGRLEGDEVILALPDGLLDHLPRNPYSYRDRGVLAIKPEQVRKLNIASDGHNTTLEPDRSSSTPNQWRMSRPVTAPADARAITQVLALLADLRAEDFAGELAGHEKRFGLEPPLLTLSWELSPPGSGDEKVAGNIPGWLKVGRAVPNRTGIHYAAVEGRPYVFTLGTQFLQSLTAEFHDTRVLSFTAEEVRGLVFRLPGRTLTYVRRSPPLGVPSDWSAGAGTDTAGVDLSRFNDLIEQLAQLRAGRFVQYDGPIPPLAGLVPPRLSIEIDRIGGKPPETLRIGNSQGPFVMAATGRTESGPVFLLPAPAWEAFLHTLGPSADLPADVFSP